MKKILLFFFSHRTLALLRWDLYFMKLRFFNFIFLKRRTLDKRLKIPSDRKFLNLGSGPRGINNEKWVNIDGFKDLNVHFLCDFNRKLPFNNETFDGIFCEHVLEHFDFNSGRLLLNECYRVLKKGGVMRIIVPDGEKILRSYFDDPSFIVNYKNCNSGLPMEAVNSWFYQRYEHQCIYDEPYMGYLLKSVGFSSSTKTSFKETTFQEKELVVDDEKYSWESLYFETFK
ncbi:class I SAM-dependent methyltransferase [Haliscomenobacter sp.]|uniref:class I SAM-dependent methyltransferase n=1 Tax=Haliscomenobacter sp. TaxID=2717303 RepID=UPI003BA9BC4B